LVRTQKKPAKEYKFISDAILCIDQFVFVSAHTLAGKTVAAEYAMAWLKH